MKGQDIKRRKSNRLQNYDYASEGAYFITFVTATRQNLFGEIVDEEMVLNAVGEIVLEEWIKSETIRQEIILDYFVIMPNHLHAIVIIKHPIVGATGRSPLRQQPDISNGPKPKSLGALVAGFKSAATIRINQHRNTPAQPIWQRNYHDRIIRNERELNATRQYILNNPLQWTHDTENPANIK